MDEWDCSLSDFAPQVSLLPPGLARKRLWNRKYPICITLADGEVSEEHVLDGPEDECERVEGQAAAVEHQLPVTLYLFGRTGREKEEWFQHFLSASRPGSKCGASCEESTGRCRREKRLMSIMPSAFNYFHLSLSLSLSISEGSCSGDPPKESTDGPHDPPAATRTGTALDYSAYMTQLIASQSGSPTRDKGSPTSRKKVKGQLSP